MKIKNSFNKILTLFILVSPIMYDGSVCAELSGEAQAAASCVNQLQELQKANVSTDTKWRPSDESLVNTLRANSAHFYSFALDNTQLLAELGVDPLAFVFDMGDWHPGNFSDFNMRTALQFGVVDNDEAGLIPPLLAYIKGYSVIKLTRPALSGKDLFEAYVAGLRGESHKQPPFLAEAMANSESEKALKKSIKKRLSYVDLKTEKFDESLGFDRLTKKFLRNNQEIAEVFHEDGPLLDDALKGYKILDRALMIRESGGSQGVLRFWYLVESELAESRGELFIFEMKQLGKPAAAEYTTQPPHIERITEMYRVYMNFENAAAETLFANYYRPVAGQYNRAYWLRLRAKSFIQFSDKVDENATDDFYSQMAIYTANRQGLAHGRQSAGQALLKRIEKDADGVREFTKEYSKAYIRAARNLHKDTQD